MILTAFVLALSIAAPTSPAHDRAYWQAIKARGFDVPAGASASSLALELSALLGSPDPELRDDLAYAILSAWIVEKRTLTPAELRPLISTWTENLRRSIGAVGDRSVLLRSFSALVLAAVAARDNAEPFLSAGEHRALVEASLTYLGAERDLRGFDDRLGWIHSAAHTADLLKFLARSPHLAVAGQRAILDGISRKMHEASVVLTFGEDERYARAIGSIIIRADFDLASFRDWVSQAATPLGGKTTVAGLRAHQNALNLLSKLAVLLARQPTLTPAALAARDAVLAAARF